MTPRKTVLHARHIEQAAKMVEFAGYLMPVQYKGIVHEHKKVRGAVGIFDVSHMGEFIISGNAAESYLQKLMLNDVSRLAPKQAQYTAMCLENGGLIDDLIVYKFEDRFMVIVNASNRDKNLNWMQNHLTDGVEVTDISDDTCLFAVQGRFAEKTLQKLTGLQLEGIKPFRFAQSDLKGLPATIARTGYTGEDGFEIAVSNEDAVAVWDAILAAGTEYGIEPVGLGARDTLRMEMKYCLYGNDIDEGTNPIEAGLGWITKTEKGDFIGRDAILQIKENGISRKLVGFELLQKAVPRHGYEILKEGNIIGHVTSGTFSPSLERGIGLGYIKLPFHEVGTEIDISVRGKTIPAKVTKTPFYQRNY
jgi:aminomethyltransferase